MSPKPPSVNAAMLGRIETSIMAESAVLDKETGRVYWEGGSSTLSASLYPKIGVPGFAHLKATILTSFLFLALVSFFAQWIRKRMNNSTIQQPPSDVNVSRITTTTPLYKLALLILQWTILKIPNLDDRTWFLGLLVAFYLLEAYNCSTRRYLSNAISSPNEVEEYIEQLRNEAPVVTWEVRCFHYERPYLLSPIKSIQAIGKLLRFFNRNDDDDDDKKKSGLGENNNNSKETSRSEIPSTTTIQKDDDNTSGPFRWRKVISHQAKRNYTFDRFDDATIAGVWKRQQWSGNSKPAPFMKIVLSKILVLANQEAKLDYFRQQSRFVASEGMRDRYAEYSTNIEVPGFQRRLVAVRPIEGVSSARLFRLTTFWIFTLLGLSLPYRIFFANHADKLRVTVVKETHAVVAAKTSSFSSWFTSSKPVQESSAAFPASRKSEEIFRQQMQDMKLYAKSQTTSEMDKVNIANADLASTNTGSTEQKKTIAGETQTATTTNAPDPCPLPTQTEKSIDHHQPDNI